MPIAETVTVAPTLGIMVLAVVAFIVWLRRSAGPSKATTRECPHCKSRMRGDASVCPHCQRESEPWKFHDGRWWRQTADGGWEYLSAPGDGVARWKRFERSAATREP